MSDFYIKEEIERLEFSIDEASSEEEAISLLKENTYDIIVTDMFMENKESGLKVLDKAKEKNPNT